MMSAGNAVQLLVIGVGLTAIGVWALRRGGLPGHSISFRRGGYQGRFLDRQDPRAGLLVVLIWLVIGVICLARGVWIVVG